MCTKKNFTPFFQVCFVAILWVLNRCMSEHVAIPFNQLYTYIKSGPFPKTMVKRTPFNTLWEVSLTFECFSHNRYPYTLGFAQPASGHCWIVPVPVRYDLEGCRYHCFCSMKNGNIFRVTGPLCGEFTGPGEFPAQRPVTRSFDVFFDLCLSKQPWGWWFETPSWLLWRHCNAVPNHNKSQQTFVFLGILDQDTGLPSVTRAAKCYQGCQVLPGLPSSKELPYSVRNFGSE